VVVAEAVIEGAVEVRRGRVLTGRVTSRGCAGVTRSPPGRGGGGKDGSIGGSDHRRWVAPGVWLTRVAGRRRASNSRRRRRTGRGRSVVRAGEHADLVAIGIGVEVDEDDEAGQLSWAG